MTDETQGCMDTDTTSIFTLTEVYSKVPSGSKMATLAVSGSIINMDGKGKLYKHKSNE